MNTKPPGLPLILVAEDEESDAYILRRAFERAGLSYPLFIVGDGQQAVDYLLGSPPYADRSIHPLPGLLLLDLKMPRMNGFDVLAWLRSRPEFKQVPVLVFTFSADDADILRARQLGARDYLVKPSSLADYAKVVQCLHARWLTGVPCVSEAMDYGCSSPLPPA